MTAVTMVGVPAPPEAAPGRDALAAERLAAHHAALLQQIDEAEHCLRAGDDDGAATAIAEAANAAWLRHPGIHASRRLERAAALVRLPRSGSVEAALPRVRGKERMLHVLTTAYASGGHTRLVERFIAADPTRAHSCIVLAQQGQPVPARLRDAVAASGGRVIVLERGGLRERAAALRAVAAKADVVATYPHPDDVMTAMGLAARTDRPPTAMLNHADHAFWLGTTAFDLLLNMRQSGADLAARRRGIPANRSTILPAPIDPPASPLPREDARRLLGLRRDDIVLLAAGSDWKFDPQEAIPGPSFADVLTPIVERDRRLRLFVFGPVDTGRWVEASRRTEGRLRAMGNRLDLGVYQQAADIYLDPFPVGSTYALLEPAVLGVPVLSYWQLPEDARTLCVDSPGVGDARVVATDRAAYEAALAHWIDHPSARAEAGARLRGQVLARHAGEAWREELTAALDAIGRAHALDDAARITPYSVDAPSASAFERALVLLPMRPPEIPTRIVVHHPLARPEPRVSPGSSIPSPAQLPHQETTHA